MEWSTPVHSFRFINDLTGDPGLLMHCQRTGEVVLFDLGSLEQVPPKEILKTKRICVTHTHLDHFIGFDRILRLHIRHGRPIEICGPPGIARNVQGKLHGYHWNLLEPDQIQFIIREIDPEGVVKSFQLSNNDGFTLHSSTNAMPIASAQIRPLPVTPAAFLTNLEDGSRIEAVCLDHGTPSVGYVCQSNMRFQVKQTELAALNLKPGPWIGALQALTANGEYDKTLVVGEKTWTVSELAAEILSYHAPRAIGYLSDLLFSWANLERIKGLMQDVECLVCESNYAEVDFLKAFDKKHLTAKQAALIAAYIGAGELRVFHISKIYKQNPQAVVQDAAQYFQTFRTFSEQAIVEEIHREILRS
jgi:ribonuclease Z